MSTRASRPSSSTTSVRATLRNSLRSSLRGDVASLAQQLDEIQAAYRAIQEQAAADVQGGRLEVSATHPGLGVRRVQIQEDGKDSASTAMVPVPSKPQHALTAGEMYDVKRRELSALTLKLIMTLNMEQIINLRQAFESHGGEVSVAQFVAIMASHLDVSKLKATPDMLIRSLVELFDSMDLDGDGELEFEELLTMVVHMGMAATEHLLLTPISPYREGPQYLISMQQIDRSISFIKEREAICVMDVGTFAFRLYDPAMKYSLSVELPLSSALSSVYVTGVQIDRQQNSGSYKRSSVQKHSYYTSGKPSASEERAKERAALEQANMMLNERNPTEKEGNMWEKIASMPLVKPMRMENGQPMLHTKHGVGEDEPEEKGAALPQNSHSQLFSEYTAKPYYGSGSSLHAFTTGTNANLSTPSNTGGPATSPSSSSSASTSSASRTPLIFIHEDYLVTSTSQHLQIWDGFPTGPATLCDSKKIRASYSCLKWCQQLQRLFAGDVDGNVDVWKIIVLPPTSSTSPPSKPTLQKEKELFGHTDIITGLESISSMGFLLTSSLDASVRMFDLQSGTEKNRFIGHRAGVVAIAYSNEYRFLLSAGSDHAVRVWSPFAEKQVYSLRGHQAPLVGVQFVPGTPQIVTADADGWMKIWDARNFACCQTFHTIAGLTSFTACSQRHKRIFVTGKHHEMFIYEQEGGPFLKRKKEEPIFAALYSPFTMTMATANKEDVKIWDGLTGNLSRVYRGLAESDLTAICLDARQRKLFVGDQHGRVRCYNYVTGAYMKSLTPHKEEIIALAYSGSRRLLVSATDRHVFVHDERPIEEQVLYMTTSSAEGTEYLTIGVSEKLSSLACAMSNGKIDFWNLDQAMRDVPMQGCHLDVITSLLFLDQYQILLSADDSGSILAWFVRPSRWKGQQAFELKTPPAKKDSHDLALALKRATISATVNGNKPDPILAVQSQYNVPGISCLAFHPPSYRLFCGHRNGHINIWNLKPLLDFLTKVQADPTSNWFAVSGAQPASGNTKETGSMPSTSRTQLLNARRTTTNTLTIPDATGLSSSFSSTSITITPPPVNLSIKDQLQQMAGALRPADTILAHDTAISTLQVILDPPALLSTAGEHVAHLWTLEGEPMGVLDSVQGLAKGYAASAGLKYKPPKHADPDQQPPEWQFSINVNARDAKDRTQTHAVLMELEQMSQGQIEAEQRAALREGRPSTRNSSAASSNNSTSRQLAAHLTQQAGGSAVNSPTNAKRVSITSPAIPSATTPMTPPSKSKAGSTVASRRTSVVKGEEKESSQPPSSALKTPASSPAQFFLSTPQSPVENYQAVTKGVISPATRASTTGAATTASTPAASPTAAASKSRRTSTKMSLDVSSAMGTRTPSRQSSAAPSAANSSRSQRSVSFSTKETED